MNIVFTLLASLVLHALPADEVPPDESRPCFAGAYYRKAVSSVDVWTGFDGIVTLPEIQFDESRRKDGTGRYLDNPSCYIGGRAGETEIDCGVTWANIKEPDGTISKHGKAFRPFWRNKKWFNGPLEAKYYFQPGDTIRLKVWTQAKDKLTMQIDLLARKGTDIAAPPLSTLTTDFDAPGFGPGEKQEFKRVNAIDQVANEGKPATATRTKVLEAKWQEAWLLRGEERRPFTSERFCDMRCPETKFIGIASHNSEQGGESIVIDGEP